MIGFPAHLDFFDSIHRHRRAPVAAIVVSRRFQAAGLEGLIIEVDPILDHATKEHGTKESVAEQGPQFANL